MCREQQTILIVEDEQSSAAVNKLHLEAEGYNTIVVHSGKQAIELVESKNVRFDLILMDIELGKGLDGTEAAEAILKTHDIPVIFLSCRTQKDIVEKTEKIINYGYVVKSSDFTVLDASIKMAFKLFDAQQKILSQELQLQTLNADLMRTQKDLRESETLYKSLFQNLNNSASVYEVIYDDTGSPCDYRYVAVNPHHENVLGLKDSFLKGKTLLEVFPKTEPAWLDAFKKVVLTDKPAIIENYSAEINRYFELTIFVPQKGQLALIGNDITKQKRIEEALRNSEMLLKASQKLSRSGGWEWDIEKDSMRWTDETYRIHDINPEDIPDGSTEHIEKGITCYKPEDQPVILDAFRNCVEHGLPYDMELPFTTFEGREIWIRTTAKAEMSNGRVVKVVGIIMDITDRKSAEEEIKDLLTEKDLILKEVHHRIINNMKTMSALLHLKSNVQKNETAAVILQDAAGQIQSMLILYQKLYISDSFQHLSLKKYLPGLVKEIISVFQMNKSINIRTQVEDISLGAQLLSPLGIIINELVTNSIKYAFVDNPDECLIILKVSGSEKSVCLEYQDNGVGLPESLSFDNSSGFGLQLVKLLVKQIHGSIRIEREQGTRFIIEFEV